jgi:Aspartyl protease
MSKSKQFVAFVLATVTATTLLCESRCPGNVESLAYQSLNGHLIVVPVSINHSGPYDFLLDTGAQMTVIDPALAGELRLATSGEASVASAGVHAAAWTAQVDLVEAGSHRVAALRVLVFDTAVLRGKSSDVRGVLGEDFLEKFDVLIDNAHRLVCLDDTGRMRAEVKGQHVALLNSESEQGNELARPPVVAVRLSDRMGSVRLELDSGADVGFLFDASFMALGVFKGASLQGNGANAQLQTFRSLPPQNAKIGSVELTRVPFVTFSAARKDAHQSNYDGLLPVGLFKTVFISRSEGFAVLEP